MPIFHKICLFIQWNIRSKIICHKYEVVNIEVHSSKMNWGKAAKRLPCPGELIFFFRLVFSFDFLHFRVVSGCQVVEVSQDINRIAHQFGAFARRLFDE